MSEDQTNTGVGDAQAAADKASAKAAKAAQKAAEKAAKKTEAKAAKEAAKQPKQNDVRRPKANTTTGKVWAIFDELSAKTGAPALIGDALKQASGTPEATVRTQYARWRKFHGITGRTAAPAPSEPAAQ
jgi:sRNA-binding protein